MRLLDQRPVVNETIHRNYQNAPDILIMFIGLIMGFRNFADQWEIFFTTRPVSEIDFSMHFESNGTFL